MSSNSSKGETTVADRVTFNPDGTLDEVVVNRHRSFSFSDTSTDSHMLRTVPHDEGDADEILPLEPTVITEFTETKQEWVERVSKNLEHHTATGEWLEEPEQSFFERYLSRYFEKEN